MLKTIIVNRNTTLMGAAMILMAFGPLLYAIFDGDIDTAPNFNFAIAEILAGLGLIMARDGDKTSEQSGAINKKGF